MAELIPTQQPHTFFGHGRKPKGPGIVQRAANYAKAIVRYKANYGYMLPLEIAEERSAICHECPQYNAEKDRCQHRKCGCTVGKKIEWSTESCPLNKWLPMFGPAPQG
jgi:hypothetical protein